MGHYCVIGGTRFFGSLLVRRLLDAGHAVTLVNRGRAGDDFGDSVERLTADANDPAALADAVAGRSFDAVVHQVCYHPRAAIAAAEAFGDRAGRFVLTSSMEVYNRDTFRWKVAAPDFDARAREDQLDPDGYGYDTSLDWESMEFLEPNYGEGKRQAEAALTDRAEVPVVVARVAHVLAEEGDFTGRMDFHVRRLAGGEPVVAHREPGRTSLVHADDVAAFLEWAATAENASGVYNACAPDLAGVYDVARALEKASGRTAEVLELDDAQGDERLSGYSCPADFGLSSDKAATDGFPFRPVAEWLPALAEHAWRER
ncbi:NAD-dependent epimerase/dehydratase family protein [Salininema proteolyticum]|uniref:NAD-dependent epimerase/dehydratase family protein n=1 Tax=Salininema proteolyticum TaxID=1607685 RepID=A0ABV8TUL3_9ACTN